MSAAFIKVLQVLISLRCQQMALVDSFDFRKQYWLGEKAVYWLTPHHTNH